MNRQWWHGKVAYQIYPKSFSDSNGDGIGDLKGIIGKLDYLKELGIDILWLSPIYCSPLADQGYDISDYYNIDPRFGTMDDLDELIKKSKEYGIGIVMDLVVNHCSDEHEWFQKACEDPDSKYGKFFYIEDYKEGDPLPCNWRSYFGGPCWDKLPGHDDKIYLHVFHKKQPDLNWENPALRTEIYKMINWWLDKGIAGFRIDAIINIKKKLPFSNYPVDGADGLSSIGNMLEEATGITDFLSEMSRETFKKYNAFSVGEVFNEKDSELPLFIGDEGCFSSMFDFSTCNLGIGENGWADYRDFTGEDYKKAIIKAHKRVDGIGFLSNIIENHDEPRGASHYIPQNDISVVSKKMLAGIYFLLPGLPFIYQGQEIGMENLSSVSSIDDIDDCSSLDVYHQAIQSGMAKTDALEMLRRFTRDNARTPFQWTADDNAGFTTGKPWLPVNPNNKVINLAAQRDDPDSVWNFYRKLIHLKKDSPYSELLTYGRFTPVLEEYENLLAYEMINEEYDKTNSKDIRGVLVLANFQNKCLTIDASSLHGDIKKMLLRNTSAFDKKNSGEQTSYNNKKISWPLTLSPYELMIAELI